jgi:alpha-1,6-mannosyltransferase
VRLRGRSAALAAIPGAFALGGLAERALLARAPTAFAVDLAQPLPVATAWGGYGAAVLTIAFAAFATAGVAAALATGAMLRDPRPGDARAIAAAAAAALAAALAWPVVFSSDVYAYAAYGDLAARGLDPYAPAPAALHDPTLDAARWQWNGPFPVCVYGPPLVAVARAADALAGERGIAAGLLLLRLAAAVAFAGSIACANLALAGLEPRRRNAILGAYALHPVLLWSVAEGHNDAFLLLAVAAAAALVRRGAATVGALLLGLATAIKAPGAVLAVAFGVDAAFVGRGDVPRRAVRVAGVAFGLAGAALWAGPPLLRAAATVGAHGRYAPAVSPQGLLGPLLAAALALGAALYGLARLRARGRDGLAWLGIAAVLALPNVQPWYALWLVPLALAGGGGLAARALYGVTFSFAMRYVPDAVGTLAPAAATLAAAVATAPLLPALGALAGIGRLKKVPTTT